MRKPLYVGLLRGIEGKNAITTVNTLGRIATRRRRDRLTTLCMSQGNLRGDTLRYDDADLATLALKTSRLSRPRNVYNV
jgi:hypothetical protein